ncbi:SRPBCC family protein, partial [Bacillus cereus]|nr:SRPBCC family protein [Bacillus cereus]
LANPDGETIIERLEVFNDKERYYTYSIMNAPFPVTNYLSTIQVKEGTESNTSLVEWSGTFTPVAVSDEEAINLVHGIYSDGLKALQQAFLD